MLTAIDVHGFAGGFTLGMAQAGFKLIGKRENLSGFGVENCEANRHLLGYDWRSESTDPSYWTPLPTTVVFGNPPCSGFSTSSPKHFRGPNSPINQCMWDLVNYAARCGPEGPEVVCFESVQPAFFMGLELMRALRGQLEKSTRRQYALYHVLHNAASVGGAAIRRRYFFMASRVPFGIEYPTIKAVPSLYETIGDLATMQMTWASQPYRRNPSWWAKSLRNQDGIVDGHTLAYSQSVQRILDLMKEVPWYTNERMIAVAKRCYEKTGVLPESFNSWSLDRYKSRNWEAGFQPRRWDFNRPAKVVMGNGPHNIIHPSEARTLTVREVSRIMGFPDAWTLQQCKSIRESSAWFGKGITVQCGRWVGEWIRRALEGRPGSFSGESYGDREYIIDVTDTYQDFPGAHRHDR